MSRVNGIKAANPYKFILLSILPMMLTRKNITTMTDKERIEAYLNGTMSPKEEKEFMQDCCNNPFLRNQMFFEGVRRSKQ